MCGRFEQFETRRYYATALGVDTSDRLEWRGGDHIPVYNIAPGRCPWMIMLRHNKPEFIGMIWGYRTPEETAAKRKPWINARKEKAMTGRYFRHMFREGRVIVPAGVWFEWTVENGKKQSWYITRRTGDGEWMVKRLYKRNGVIKLLSENPDHAPIVLQEGQELVIFGVVTYVINEAK